MSDIESEIDDITFPQTSMFAKRKLNASSNNGSRLTASMTASVVQYAITVNICPTKLMNKKHWRDYSQDQQRQQLSRIEAAFRRKTPSVTLDKIEYEVCPKLNQIHFHALYKVDTENFDFASTIQNYYCKYDSTDKNTKNRWRHLDFKVLPDQGAVESWIKYISKDIV